MVSEHLPYFTLCWRGLILKGWGRELSPVLALAKHFPSLHQLPCPAAARVPQGSIWEHTEPLCFVFSLIPNKQCQCQHCWEHSRPSEHILLHLSPKFAHTQSTGSAFTELWYRSRTSMCEFCCCEGFRDVRQLKSVCF